MPKRFEDVILFRKKNQEIKWTHLIIYQLSVKVFLFNDAVNYILTWFILYILGEMPLYHLLQFYLQCIFLSLEFYN